MIHHNRGVSLTGLVMALGIMGILIVAGATVLNSQGLAAKYLGQKAEVVDLKTRITQLAQNAPACACQLNPNLTLDDSNDNNLAFDSTATGGVINVIRLREGCALTDPIIVEEGQQIGAGLFVDKVELADLRPAGGPNEWRGRWRISFKSGEATPIAPMQMFQFFFADPASVAANPSRALVERCKSRSTPGLVGGCPAGMILIGAANQFGTYCIDQNQRAGKAFLAAKAECGAFRSPGFGPSRLCNYSQWYMACNLGVGTNFTGDWEWIADNDNSGSIMLGAAACNSLSSDLLGASHAFRCCVR